MTIVLQYVIVESKVDLVTETGSQSVYKTDTIPTAPVFVSIALAASSTAIILPIIIIAAHYPRHYAPFQCQH